jgi:4-hydroxy-tetrahydrodipicolinate synthase
LNSAWAKVERAEQAAAKSVDLLVVTLPTFFPVVSPERQRAYFEHIADRVQVPILLYNIPQNVGVSISPEAVRGLSVHPNIAGIKDSAGDRFAFRGHLLSASESFVVLQGREQLARASLLDGAAGTVSALANVAPSLLRALHSAVARDDTNTATELQSTVAELAEIFDFGYWLSALKCAMSLLGFAVGDPTFPLAPCTDEERSAIESILARPHLDCWLMRKDGYLG